jgi:hypothetical protein
MPSTFHPHHADLGPPLTDEAIASKVSILSHLDEDCWDALLQMIRNAAAQAELDSYDSRAAGTPAPADLQQGGAQHLRDLFIKLHKLSGLADKGGEDDE